MQRRPDHSKPKKAEIVVREVKLKDLISYFFLSIPIILILIHSLIHSTRLEFVTVRWILIILLSVGIYLHFKRFLLGSILLYKALAPMKVRNVCRFTPSCSQYALISIMRYGIILGCILSLCRISRCHYPYGGYDPPSLTHITRFFAARHK